MNIKLNLLEFVLNRENKNFWKEMKRNEKNWKELKEMIGLEIMI